MKWNLLKIVKISLVCLTICPVANTSFANPAGNNFAPSSDDQDRKVEPSEVENGAEVILDDAADYHSEATELAPIIEEVPEPVEEDYEISSPE